jgi:very-short-patch-repair endonuclease
MTKPQENAKHRFEYACHGWLMTKNLDRARDLRYNQTEAEDIVWRQLRNRRFVGFKFRRQVPLGAYIVDFVCFSQRFILELDGGQHNEVKQKEYDDQRDQWLKSQGFNVVRIWNNHVYSDWEAVEEMIWRELHKSASAKSPHAQEEKAKDG